MPYTGIVLSIVAFVAGFYLIQLGHWLVAAGLFPKAVESFADEYGRRPVRATLLGLFTFGPLLLLMLNVASLPIAVVRLLALVGGFAALIIALVGSAGLALRIGNGLCADGNRWQRVSRGGSMLSLCCLTPFIGTFFVLPVALCSGFGVFLLARPWKATSTATLPVQTAAPALS